MIYIFISKKLSFVKRIKDNKKTILLIVFILLLAYGSFIRFYGLGEKSFWIDESMSALAAKKISDHGRPILESGALYSRAGIFHRIMSFFLLFGHNEFNARIISVIFGILTCVLAFLIGKEYNFACGLISFIFSLFLEIFVVYSRQARMYQMAMFFFFLTLYLLYKSIKDNRYFLWSALSFIVAYNTLPLAIVLVPLFFYIVIIKRMNFVFYLGVLLFGIHLGYIAFSGMSEFKMYYINVYMQFIKTYIPFILVAIAGVMLGWKKKITWFMVSSLIFLAVAVSVHKTFASRYVYMAFLPIVVFSSYALSKIKFKWLVVIVYIVWISNIFHPITYVSILIPEKVISHVEFTEPGADFRGVYGNLKEIYNNESLIVSFTPAAEWYFKRPDYWIYFSFTGLACENNSCSTYNGRDYYTGADIIYNLTDFNRIKGDKIIVMDYWGYGKINRGIAKFISSNCTTIIEKEGIAAFRCINGTFSSNPGI